VSRAGVEGNLSDSRLERGRVSAASTTLRLAFGAGGYLLQRVGLSDKKKKRTTPPSCVWGEGGGKKEKGLCSLGSEARVRAGGEKGTPTCSYLG
jgi:hypothetical protein